MKEREDIRVSNFVRGLNLPIRWMLALQTLETLDEVMNKTRRCFSHGATHARGPMRGKLRLLQALRGPMRGSGRLQRLSKGKEKDTGKGAGKCY